MLGLAMSIKENDVTCAGDLQSVGDGSIGLYPGARGSALPLGIRTCE